MLLRAAVAAMLTSVAGTAFAADAVRPIIVPPAPLPVVTGPAAAGDVSLGGGALWINGIPSTSGISFGQAVGSGRASLPLGPAWNLEVEANGRDFFESLGGVSVGAPIQADGYVHLWDRKPTSAWGIFGGVSPIEVSFVSLGGEFKHYAPHGSLGAAAAVVVVPNSIIGNSTGWALDASANHYLNPDLRFGIQGAVLGGFDFGVGSNGAVWSATADLEKRSANLPLSLWGSAGWQNSLEGNGWSAMGGLRIFLDKPGSTLQSHEQDVPFSFVLPNIILGGL